jgi:hypothetical protein
MKNYVIYSLAPNEKGKVNHRFGDMFGPWTLQEARGRVAASVGRKGLVGAFNAPVEYDASFKVLRLPDLIPERESLLRLGEKDQILRQPTRYSSKAYAVLAPMFGPEEGVSYVAGWYYTQGAAKECNTAGDLVVVIHKGAKISIGGDSPVPLVPDLWTIP